jgi:DNA-binding beta-propeller fold protein YncE
MVGTTRTFSRAGTIVALVVAIACVGAGSASAAPLLWSLNFETNSVSTIDTGTDQPVGKPIPTGEKPISIAITPDGRRTYVANFVGNSVTAIDTATRKPMAPPVPLPANAERIAISPDGKIAYVTVESNEHVFPLDTATNELGTPIAAGPEASAVAFSPDGSRAYVGVAPHDVQVIETATGKAVGQPIEVGGYPSAIVFTPNGETAYVAAGNEVAAISTALGQRTLGIPGSVQVSGIAVDPHGLRLYVSRASAGSVTAYNTVTNEPVGSPVTLAGEPEEIAITPGDLTAFVAVAGAEAVVPLDISNSNSAPRAGTPINMAGAGVGQLVVAPDQSPTAAFTAPSPIAGAPALFSGAGSTDPDGTVASFSWSFGDGGVATGVAPSHVYVSPGTYSAQLSLIDNEGCGAAQVFTGRTAYCSGGASNVIHPVQVSAPAPTCTTNFAVGRVSHNRRNGTVRLRLRFFSTGWFLLFGKKIHAVTRKVRKPGTTVVTLHARVELNKRLKKTHRAGVRYRVTFTPNAGCGTKTVHRSVALLRSARKKHAARKEHHA